MNQPVVLYVEDEPNDVFLVRWAFNELGIGSMLKVVTDGQQALDYLSGKEPFSDRHACPLPSLMLLDLNLPIASGFDVLQWIREQPPLRALPVVVLTSSDRSEDIHKAMQLGATEYVVKSGSPIAILAQVKDMKERWLA